MRRGKLPLLSGLFGILCAPPRPERPGSREPCPCVSPAPAGKGALRQGESSSNKPPRPTGCPSEASRRLQTHVGPTRAEDFRETDFRMGNPRKAAGWAAARGRAPIPFRGAALDFCREASPANNPVCSELGLPTWGAACQPSTRSHWYLNLTVLFVFLFFCSEFEAILPSFIPDFRDYE